MAYEACVSLVVIPEEARHRALGQSATGQRDDLHAEHVRRVARRPLPVGRRSVLLWASIWLACLNSSAQYRLAVRDRDSAGVRAPDLEVQQPGDAFLL